MSWDWKRFFSLYHDLVVAGIWILTASVEFFRGFYGASGVCLFIAGVQVFLYTRSLSGDRQVLEEDEEDDEDGDDFGGGPEFM